MQLAKISHTTTRQQIRPNMSKRQSDTTVPATELKSIIEAIEEQKNAEITALESLTLPSYASAMMKSLTRNEITHFRRCGRGLSLSKLIATMSGHHKKEGSTWPELATLFTDLCITKAVEAAESDEEYNYKFSVYTKVIDDLWQLMHNTGSDKNDNCVVKHVPFESLSVLVSLVCMELIK